MTKEEIIEALKSELAQLPKYPEDTGSNGQNFFNVKKYDEAMNEGLENLRDVVTAIVEEN